jgi:hypothetical protein
MTLIALLLGRIRHLGHSEGLRIIDELEALPDKVQRRSSSRAITSKPWRRSIRAQRR